MNRSGGRRAGRSAAATIGTVVLVALVGACGSESSSSSGSTSSPAGSGSATPVGTGVQGRVTDETGAPVPRATISSDAASGRVAQSANVTDAEGRFFLPLPPGTWEVSVAAPGHEPTEFEVEVADGEQVQQEVVLRG